MQYPETEMDVKLLKFGLGSFHKLRLHLGVGRWSEKRVVYYIKSANLVKKCQKIQT